MGHERAALREQRNGLMATGLALVRRARRFQAGINILCVMGEGALAVPR